MANLGAHGKKESKTTWEWLSGRFGAQTPGFFLPKR
jgi:hypothetical protein